MARAPRLSREFGKHNGLVLDTHQIQYAVARLMSNDVPPEVKARVEAAKKELIQALKKKRSVDMQLVRRLDMRLRVPSQCSPRPELKLQYITRRAPTSQRPQRIAGETSYTASTDI